MPTDMHGIDELDLFHGRVSPSKRIFRFKQHYRGSRLVDLVPAFPLDLGSTKFFECLRRAGVTGYRNYPAIIEMHDGRQLDDYRVLAITGTVGRIDWKSTPVVPAKAYDGTPLGGNDYLGMAFDINAWDGSDLCAPTGTTFIIATDRFVDAVTSAKLTNMECIPLAEFRTVYDGD